MAVLLPTLNRRFKIQIEKNKLKMSKKTIRTKRLTSPQVEDKAGLPTRFKITRAAAKNEPSAEEQLASYSWQKRKTNSCVLFAEFENYKKRTNTRSV
jgi:hypothetical protein